MPITNPRGRRIVEMIRIAIKAQVIVSDMEKLQKNWEFRVNVAFSYRYFLSFISFPKPFCWLFANKTAFRRNRYVKTELKFVKIWNTQKSGKMAKKQRR